MATAPGRAAGAAPGNHPTSASIRYRPTRLSDVRGHGRVKDNLQTLILAARERKAVLPHLLFSGPPGLGKTTLALALASEMAGPLVHLACDGLPVSALRDIFVTGLEPGSVLFLDEVHRLQGPVVELLYGPLEDGRATVKGETVIVPPFTAVAATTHVGRIPAPLRRRFRHHFLLDFLTVDDLATAAWYAAAACRIRISREGCVEIARRSKGTPRRAVQLVEWITDCAVAAGRSLAEIGPAEVDQALLQIEVGREGFDAGDRRYFDALATQFRGGPVGLRAMSSVLGEEPDTLEREVEPWLLRAGYLVLTPKGRCIGPGPR